MRNKIKKTNKLEGTKQMKGIYSDKYKKQEVLSNIALYRYVYKGIPSHIGAFVLLCSMLMQGVSSAYANETEAQILNDEEPILSESLSDTEKIEVVKNDKDKSKELDILDSQTLENEVDENNNSSPDDNETKDNDSTTESSNLNENVTEEDFSNEELTFDDIATTTSSEENIVQNSDVTNDKENEYETDIATSTNFTDETHNATSSLETNIASSNLASTTEENIEDVGGDKNQIDNSASSAYNIASTSEAITSLDDVSSVGSTTEQDKNSKENEINDFSNVDSEVVKTQNSANDAIADDGVVEHESEEVIDEMITPATTTLLVATSSGELVVHVENDTAFQFNENDCTRLATGSYYCYETNEKFVKNELFAAPDQDGDLEIFLTKEDKQVQITKNNVLDASPYFDKKSNTIVWHRLVNDRYQIISYSLDSGLETQLTNGSVNNMEPSRQGDYIVWQRWVDNSWNIILYNGEKEKQITKTKDHNIGPHIQGSLVIWNRHGQAGQKTIEMYDLTTENFVTVNDPEGLSVDNPRMVLVYDSLHANGDIITKGYDIFAKKFIQLDTLPRDIPDEIPDSESTSEVRAIIQTKPVVKTISEVVDDDSKDTDKNNESDGIISKESATTSQEMKESVGLTLDMRVEEDKNETEVVTEETENFDNEIPDLEIPQKQKNESSTTTKTNSKSSE